MTQCKEKNNNYLPFKYIKINVDDFPKAHLSFNESHLDLIDVFKPVILAEIFPGRYNLKDWINLN